MFGILLEIAILLFSCEHQLSASAVALGLFWRQTRNWDFWWVANHQVKWSCRRREKQLGGHWMTLVTSGGSRAQGSFLMDHSNITSWMRLFEASLSHPCCVQVTDVSTIENGNFKSCYKVINSWRAWKALLQWFEDSSTDNFKKVANSQHQWLFCTPFHVIQALTIEILPRYPRISGNSWQLGCAARTPGHFPDAEDAILNFEWGGNQRAYQKISFVTDQLPPKPKRCVTERRRKMSWLQWQAMGYRVRESFGKGVLEGILRFCSRFHGKNWESWSSFRKSEVTSTP